EEGLAAVFARHQAMSRRAQDGSAALGLQLQCPDLARMSPTLTALAVPRGVDPARLRQGLVRRGILVAEGLGPHRASAVRTGHLGDIRPADLERTLDALADTLAEMRG